MKRLLFIIMIMFLTTTVSYSQVVLGVDKQYLKEIHKNKVHIKNHLFKENEFIVSFIFGDIYYTFEDNISTSAYWIMSDTIYTKSILKWNNENYNTTDKNIWVLDLNNGSYIMCKYLGDGVFYYTLPKKVN